MSTYAPHQNVPMCYIFYTCLLAALHLQTVGVDPQAQAQIQAQARVRAQARAQNPDQVCRLPVLININV